MKKMTNEKRLINVNPAYIQHILAKVPYYADEIWKFTAMTQRFPTVEAVEVPCHCCDCYYLLNGKNSFGLYFFCGHQNGLKNLRNTEKDFCSYGERKDNG